MNNVFPMAVTTTSQLPSSGADHDIQTAEGRRVQELLRYFQPTGVGMDITKKPRISSDLSLNAFAQLAALKLNCQRSFISLMDNENQYIIAEATRSISLESEDIYEGDGDALLTGAATLDLEWGVCASTISIFSSTDGSMNTVAQYMKADKEYYIMNDMSKLPDYMDRPYVSGWPYMRYYVEVPICSPSGLAIGTICGVTNEAREGVDMKGIAILKEIANAVMDHLDLVVSRVQRKRAEKMINGLGLFAEGGDSRWWMNPKHGSATIEDDMSKLRIETQEESLGVAASSEHDTRAFRDAEFASTPSDYFGICQSAANHTSGIDSPRANKDDPYETPVIEATLVDPHGSISSSESTALPSQKNPGEHTPEQSTSPDFDANSPGQKKQPQSNNLDGTLARATSLIREAVDLNGVAFYDSRIAAAGAPIEGVFADPLDPAKPSLDGIPIHRSPQFDATMPNSTNPAHRSKTRENLCKVLSSSTSEGISAFPECFSQSLLHCLLERFPRGGILQFDQVGSLVGQSELEAPSDIAAEITEPQDAATGPHVSRSKQSLSGDIDFLAELHKLPHIFPGSRSIILFPLALTTDKLFAYAVGFTTEATRVFQREDFAYITSFSNLIMAELSRLDIVAADTAKSNFISSISHELRSPLHGILASAELLKEIVSDTTSIDIINTIEACGSTLLDTLDNLLTFAKINNFTVAQRRKSHPDGILAPGHGMAESVKDLTSDVDMCALVEEVMNSSIAGHHFRTRAETDSVHIGTRLADEVAVGKSPVMVICDIEPSLHWTFDTQAGVWKRILMNLLGNSLKYTSSGFIHVRLRQEPPNNSISGPHQTQVYLAVEDTGKGIGPDFLANHLYKPFRQEHNLQPGTGLGLSIVRQLVMSINGKIDVTSTLGSGTVVSITATLETSTDMTSAQSPVQSTPFTVLSEMKGVGVGLLDFEHLDIPKTATSAFDRQAKGSLVLKASLTSGLEALGCCPMAVSEMDTASRANNVNIVMTTENHYRNISSATLRMRNLPIIILCADLNLDYRQVLYNGGPIIYLSQPYGPQRLARAIKSCIPFCYGDARNSNVVNLSPTIDTTPEQSFSVAQPLFTAEPPLPSAPLKKATVVSNLNQEGQPRALLVEDNAINLRLLVTFMKKLNCPYETAVDGQKAVDYYKAAGGAFDIIFMDIQMPNKDGLSASLEIRQFEQQDSLSRTPIIAVTGLASAEVQEQASLSGVDLLLTKPVPLKTLKAIVASRFPQTLFPN